MAYDTDVTITTADLTAREAEIVSLANSAGIDVNAKIALAKDFVGGWLRMAGYDLDDVQPSAELTDAIAWQAVAAIRRDLYTGNPGNRTEALLRAADAMARAMLSHLLDVGVDTSTTNDDTLPVKGARNFVIHG